MKIESLREPVIGGLRLAPRIGATLALCAVFFITGCRGEQKPPPPIPRNAIYARADLHFTEVTLFKPADPEAGSELQRKSAPLIMQAVQGTNVVNDNPMTPIFVHEGHVELKGRKLEQVTFLWRYPSDGNTNSRSLPAQGVRITHNAAGLPIIWEVLADTSGSELVFVSQNLETAAILEFGPPLPNRRFAVERDLTETPRMVVARALSDSPVAMGPIVYLNRGTRDVGTLICRCMEAQASNLVGEGVYETTLVNADEMAFLIEESLPSGKFQRADWRVETAGANRLERILRLPQDF